MSRCIVRRKRRRTTQRSHLYALRRCIFSRRTSLPVRGSRIAKLGCRLTNKNSRYVLLSARERCDISLHVYSTTVPHAAPTRARMLDGIKYLFLSSSISHKAAVARAREKFESARGEKATANFRKRPSTGIGMKYSGGTKTGAGRLASPVEIFRADTREYTRSAVRDETCLSACVCALSAVCVSRVHM